MREPTLDQALGYAAAAQPVDDEHGGGFHPAIQDLTTGSATVFPEWCETADEARKIAAEMLSA